MAIIKGTAGNDDPLVGTSGNDQIYGYAGEDNISGGDGDDSIYAGDDNDTIDGGEGNDFIDGGAGDDTMTGGNGNDLYVVDSLGDVVIELGGGGIDEVRTTFDYSLVGTEIENLTITGAVGRAATGNDYNNKIKGSAGADTILGLGGDDSISANDGNDTVDGGAGNDWMDGGVGVDVLSYASATAGVSVNLALTGAQNTGGAGVDTIRNFENLTGSDYNDVLTGTSGDNRLSGGLGVDTMIGGAGNDRYSYTAGDTIIENANEGTDLVNANDDYTLGANLEQLVLFNSAIYGGGNELANIIRGNANNNIINGGGGIDSLYGGAGADTFILDAPDASSADHINDFVSGEDVLQVSAATFGLSAGALDPDYFTFGSAATAAHAQFYLDSYNKLYFDADGVGGAAGVLVASFGTTTIDAGDIVVA